MNNRNKLQIDWYFTKNKFAIKKDIQFLNKEFGIRIALSKLLLLICELNAV